MGEAKHNILIKFEQQQRMNHYFQGRQMMDTVSLADFSESLSYDHMGLLKR